MSEASSQFVKLSTEMNAHLPQSLQTMQELRTLAAVSQQIMSPRDSSPIVSVVQDIASGVYRLTKNHVTLSERQVFNILAPMYPKVKGMDRGEVWTGRQLLSSIIPPNVNLRSPNKFFDERKTDDRENFVVIEGGELVQGTVDKSIYQARSKGLVHMIYNDYSPEQTRDFFDATQQLICNWLVLSGFSTGISDLVVDSATKDKFADVISTMKHKVDEIITRVHRGELNNMSTKNDAEFFEQEVNAILNKAANQVGALGTEQVDDRVNRMINMIKSGSKGNQINFAQMIGCLGQQNVDGNRIPYGFDDRTLPHFTRFDDGPAARGFVENSFISGLSPQEFFFHAMGGREGLIDTAVKSVTGDTPIIIIEDGKLKYVRIGAWIDARLALEEDEVKYYPNDRNLELLHLDNTVYIPTMDEDGIVTWGQVTDMTRHDPGTTLYRLKTESGRSVTVTESKSLLIWNKETGRFNEVNTPEIKVGDLLPVTTLLAEPPVTMSQVKDTEGKVVQLDHSTGYLIGSYIVGASLGEHMPRALEAWIVSVCGRNEELHVPDFAFLAPVEFITGLLTGFTRNSFGIDTISTLCKSTRLVEGIAMLCSRLGVFASLSECSGLPLITIHNSLGADYTQHNHVICDKIVSIEPMGVEENPKMYDLTIPSTLNFGLANGLQVRDTSSTGYIQRQLVKAMEDCKVYTDRTVRNATGAVVQFLYGEDGMDAIKIESQSLPYVHMTLDKLADEYLIRDRHMFESLLTTDVYQKLLADDAKFEDECARHFQNVLDDREFFIVKVNKGAANSNIAYPVHVQRIIGNAQALYGRHGGGVLLDLSPSYILETVERLCKQLYVTKANNGNRFMQIILRAHLSPKRVLMVHRLNRAAFDLVIQQVVQRFYESFAHPGDMVGVVAAQSVGEPSTQLTLNSIVKESEILLRIDGHLTKTQIGDFIDARVDAAKVAKDVEQHPNDTWLAWIKDAQVEVLSCDEQGSISWRRVEAVTKHPVVNKDGSNTLLKVVTRSGREVVATKAKSFLKRINNKVLPVDGEELKVGDRLPVSTVLPLNMNEVTHFELARYLPMDKWLYMSQVAKALSRVNEFAWWKKYNGKEFVLPYSRSDAFTDTFVKGNVKQVYAPDCVYPKNTNRVPSTIPERIPLDEDFGFFVGAYLAEGHAINHAVLIANVDQAFLDRIKRFCDRYNVSYHVKTRHINNGVSTTIRIPSTVLGTLMREQFGELSQHKRMPAELLAAPKPFLRELINGYFSGDGSVSKKYAEIKADSTSRSMLESIRQVLLRFDIFCGIHLHNNKQTCFKSEIQQAYTLLITSGNARRFAEEFQLVIADKQQRLHEVLSQHESRFLNGRDDKVPDVVLSYDTIPLLHRDKIGELLLTTIEQTDLDVLEKALMEQVMWDEVVSIEEVRSEHPYVYDLTVEGTRNFNIYSGLCMRDTFHSAGISSASKAVRGVPRLQELLSCSKAIKTPAMTITVNPEYRKEATTKEAYKARCLDVLNELRTVRFKDIVSASRIYFDPDDFNTRVPEDRGFLDLYRRFLETDGNGLNSRSVSPWLLRLELNRAKMLELGLLMVDVQSVLEDFYSDRVECMFSDDNSDNMIMRVKQTVDGTEDPDDLMTELKALEYNIIETVAIRGVSRIEKVSMREHNRQVYNIGTGAFESVSEWVIDTDGSHLRAVLGNKHIDPVLTTTNNIIEVCEVLGIEAAKAALYYEIVEVLSGINVNYRHLSLLIDTMTNKGVLMPINRHGINRGDAGPLAKSSFEESIIMLVGAGVFGELDKVNGVSANVMLGQIAPCGTGETQVLLDEQVLTENIDRLVKERAIKKPVSNPVQAPQRPDADTVAQCAPHNLSFVFELPEAAAPVASKKPVKVDFV